MNPDIKLSKMINYIRLLTGMKSGEEKLLLICTIYASLIGFSQSWLRITPMALFLTHYHAALLPYVYIAIPIVLIFTGLLFSFLERYLTTTQILLNYILGIGIIYLSLWFIAAEFSFAWIYFLLLIWSQVIFDIFDLILYSVLNRLFTLDQGKRLFSIIGMNQQLAAIIGSLSVPLLLLITNSINIILLTNLFIFLIFLLIKIIFKKFKKRVLTDKPIIKDAEKKFHEGSNINWLKNSYLINNMLFALLSLIVFTIVDILFYSESSKVFTDQISLANFLSIFFVILNIFELFNRLITSNILIRKFVLVVPLLARSFCVGIIIMALPIIYIFYNNDYSIFILFSVMKLFDEGLSNSVLRQAVLLLYHPLTPKRRIWLQRHIELIIIPFGTILGSTTLIFIQKLLDNNQIYVAIILAIIIIATVFLIFLLEKGYINNLKKRLPLHALVAPYLNYTKAESKSLSTLAIELEEALYNNNHKNAFILIKKIGHIKTNAATEVLFTSLFWTKDGNTTHFILHQLDICHYQVDHREEFEKISELFLSEIEHLELIIDLFKKMKDNQNFKLLKKKFMHQIQACMEIIFILLKLYYPRETINRIDFYLDSKDADKACYARELMINTLQGIHLQPLQSVLDQLSLVEFNQKLVC